ncbi:MAG: RNA methyltransferase [Ginsengibacter sp.]
MLKYIQSLHLKKFRTQENCFLAEGDKIMKEFLLAKKFELQTLCAQASWLDQNKSLLKGLSPDIIYEINEQSLNQISMLKTPNAVLGVFKQNLFNLPGLKNRISIMLDDLQDPGNMGTIIRIADWFGIEQIICSKNSVDSFNPKVIQSSMGSINRVNIFYGNLFDILEKNKDVTVYTATLAGTPYYDLPEIKEGIIIIGNESQGIDPDLLKLNIHRISIPKIGHAESLNAAVAAGILISHIKMRSLK